MTREKRDIRPVLFKFGVALAFSLGGILFNFLRNKRNKPSASQSSPEHQNQANSSCERIEHKNDDEDDHALQKTPNYCHLEGTASEKDESALLPNSTSDNHLCNFSPSKRSSGDKESYLLPEFNDLVKEFDLVAIKGNFSPRKDVEVLPNGSAASSNERTDQEQEIKRLRDMVTTLTERERCLEIQLLEYYGLKEQETAVMELQNRLKINNMEAKLFNLKIESLQADKKRLEEQVADYAKVVTELEAAKGKIKLLRKKLRSEAEQNREQILALKERVSKVQDAEKNALSTDSDIQSKLHKLEDFEEEMKELKESNESLRVENSALAQKIDYLQTIASSILDDEETQTLREESNRLRIQNEDMAREMEQLHAARVADIEELVYLRWINACLRYELRNYQATPGQTTARDLSKSLSPKSEEKAKQLILEYAHKEGSTGDKGIDIADFDSDRWSSSASYITESGDNDDSSLDVSSTSKTHNSTKTKIFSKLIHILRGKGSRHLKRSSSLDLAVPAEDLLGRSSSLSPRCSNGASPGAFSGTDAFNTRSRNSSQSSSRLSLDLQRDTYFQGSRSIRRDDSIKSERVYGKSHDDSSFLYKVINPISEDVADTPAENQQPGSNSDTPKSNLGKYADALKDSRRKPLFRKRSASVSSF
ncbi:OLC1v1014909C1 [Oldenlandia corymbosa var. corymbosa]|uniref:OLC1v1014909C1 n=1 Tax=Oldenlandia corymbosa var. corymbosa TaxID=529605 RepID=A0AAV1E2E4_OLDCO|nr:OLC1v1014909C1 [Oldenlandia corymbosa var. corymbosa]